MTRAVGKFIIATSPERCSFDAIHGSQNYVRYHHYRKDKIAETLSSNEFKIGQNSLFVRQEQLQHAGAGWGSNNSLRYYTSSATIKNPLPDAFVVEYGAGFNTEHRSESIMRTFCGHGFRGRRSGGRAVLLRGRCIGCRRSCHKGINNVYVWQLNS